MPLTHRYAENLSALASPVAPQVLSGQRLQLVNHALATSLRLPESWWQQNHITEQLSCPASVLSAGAVAQKYGGHQFGQWNPYLGDGRGLLLGEATDKNGHSFDLHLKGAGQTPYSRGADGRAVLRSTIREYLGSEALHALGIASSRSLCLFSSDETVFREQPEPGAMMIRTSPSHIRFGHFEFYYHNGEKDKLDALFQYTLANHFPECLDAENPHLALLNTIVLRTARLIALWQNHGFVHGVMNTDNMSIHGITFDYGPYAFMESFKSNAVFNHSDHQGRYAFNQQPSIGLWNLNVLAHCFSDYCSVDDIRAALMKYETTFIGQFQHVMAARMGLPADAPGTQDVVNQWLELIEKEHADYTSSFRKLALTNHAENSSKLRDNFIDRQQFDSWWQQYQQHRDNSVSQDTLLNLNPVVVPRTPLLQHAIEQAQAGDFSECEALLQAVTSPFDICWDNHKYAKPGEANQGGMLSCSS